MAKEIVAMILAGGRGSRLYALTQKTAKPAVSFGGKYRIVDFPLSNCVNSNIDTVGIATQYQPQKLNEYIGNGIDVGVDAVGQREVHDTVFAAKGHRRFCRFLCQRVQTRATSAGKDHCHDFFCHSFILPFNIS